MPQSSIHILILCQMALFLVHRNCMACKFFPLYTSITHTGSCASAIFLSMCANNIDLKPKFKIYHLLRLVSIIVLFLIARNVQQTSDETHLILPPHFRCNKCSVSVRRILRRSYIIEKCNGHGHGYRRIGDDGKQTKLKRRKILCLSSTGFEIEVASNLSNKKKMKNVGKNGVERAGGNERREISILFSYQFLQKKKG